MWAGYLSRYSDWLLAGRSWDRISVGRDFPPVQTGPGAHPASCTMGIGYFPGVKYGRRMMLTTYPLLLPRSWKSRAIPLPTLWAKPRPVTWTLYLYSHLNSRLFTLKLLNSPICESAMKGEKKKSLKSFWLRG